MQTAAPAVGTVQSPLRPRAGQSGSMQHLRAARADVLAHLDDLAQPFPGC